MLVDLHSPLWIGWLVERTDTRMTKRKRGHSSSTTIRTYRKPAQASLTMLPFLFKPNPYNFNVLKAKTNIFAGVWGRRSCKSFYIPEAEEVLQRSHKATCLLGQWTFKCFSLKALIGFREELPLTHESEQSCLPRLTSSSTTHLQLLQLQCM